VSCARKSSLHGTQHPAHVRLGVRESADIRATYRSPTERLAETALRLGQGKIRADLLDEFASGCAATTLGIPLVPRASHIVPWRNSDNTQRRDPKNGLLLSANLDALFDRYMITFRPDGTIRMSYSLSERDRGLLGPLPSLQTPPCEERAAYLRRHNAEFDRLEEERNKFRLASHK
jgi:hypothetical protein